MLRTIRIKDLSLVRGERRLFSGLDLEVAAGQAVALTGRNGAGKTSLLRAIAGTDCDPRGRKIGFEGEAGGLEAEVARSDALHLVGHHDGLKSARSALGGAAVPGPLDRRLGGLGPRPPRRGWTWTACSTWRVRRLSAGQRRRVALARLLASPRPLWLLDEPMAPLDAGQRQGFGA
jgi:heme exporter protein A